jgi:uncharacterized membrane protein
MRPEELLMPVATRETPAPVAAADRREVSTATRFGGIDVVRGAVMVLMAIDHVRVYSGLPAGGPSAGIFFTRWVTHFCAPAFVFFAGTSAFLAGRTRTRAELSRYLVTRGAWLIVLELTVIRIAWTFNLDFAHYILLGVIWMIGWCMILMAGLHRLSTPTVAAIGIGVMLAQNLVGVAASAAPQFGPLWRVLYLGGGFSAGPGGPVIAVLYSIVPWVGVMAAGYGFGAIVVRDANARRRLCFRIGLAATAAFLVLASIAVLSTPARPGAPPAIFRLLNQQKYPASQLFLLMTLGPTIAVLPLAERARGAVARTLAVFGRTPFFYYLLHIPVIHTAALVVSLVRSGRVDPWLFTNHPVMPPPSPPGYQWSLALLYLVFAIVIALLYPVCAWFAGLKGRHRDGLLRYL